MVIAALVAVLAGLTLAPAAAMAASGARTVGFANLGGQAAEASIEEARGELKGHGYKGLDSGALTRLEHGETRTPTPETLRALAEALDVPLADLYAVAGHVVPYDLPSLVPYLQTRYGQLPDTALAEASAYLEHLIDEHGLNPQGPLEFEDESTAPPQG